MGDAGASISVVLVPGICVNPCWHLKGKVGSWDRISGGVVCFCWSEYEEKSYR